MLLGVDVASWQGYPDWGQLRAEGHEFMISKVCGENNYVNPYAALNLERAHAAGLVTGAYDWVEPQDSARFGGDGGAAAEDYLRVLDRIGAWRKGFLLCVDWETPEWYHGPLGKNVEGYMRAYIHRLLDFQPVIVYTAPYFLAETGGYSWSWLAKTKYWIAAPGGGMLPDTAPWPAGNLVKPWPAATFHQHQWHARSSAVMNGGFDFDRNRFDGTRDELLALGYLGNEQPTPPEDEVKEPPADHLTTYQNAKGETIVVINYGGVAANTLGTNVVDAGVSVVNAQGAVYDRTVRANEFEPWKQRS